MNMRKTKTMSHFNLDTDSVRKLADILKETGLSEIEYVEGDKRIKVAGGTVPTLASYVQTAAPAAVAPEAKAEAPVQRGTPVTSPMVGTVYLAAEPGAAPFVKVGDRVKQGDTLLIIEAMKVMNPIKAPQSGEIVEILAADAKPVEFGETLLLIA